MSATTTNRDAALAAYAEDVVRLEMRVGDLEAERDTYRDLLYGALDHCHRLFTLVRVQRRALNDRTREIESTYTGELRAIDDALAHHWFPEGTAR